MSYEVRFEPSGRRIRVPAGTTLLEATRRAGLPVASACGSGGICARCGLSILQADASLPDESERERRAKADNRIEPGLRLACRIALEADLVVTADYW